jgi:hypothetical protein
MENEKPNKGTILGIEILNKLKEKNILTDDECIDILLKCFD